MSENTTNDRSHFKIGVNYWPQRNATRMWRDFDSGELCEDLDRLREWNLSPIRIFLRRDDFQPDQDRINTKALHRLSKLADWIADRGLSLWVCFFMGHMHRINWLPGWQVSGESHPGDPYSLVNGFPVYTKPKWPLSDPGLMQAQNRFIEEVIAVLCNHPAAWAYDLGERLSSFHSNTPTDLWRGWLGETTEQIRRWDSKTPITLGLQPTDLLDVHGLNPMTCAESVDFLSISCLAREIPWTHNYPDPVSPLFLAELVRILADDKPVWVSAVGLAQKAESHKIRCSTTVPENPFEQNDPYRDQPVKEPEAEEYARLTLECLRRNGMPGALWWCFSDYPFAKAQAPFCDYPHETSYGLVGEGWRLKRALSGIAAVDRDTTVCQRPDKHWMDIEPEQYWRAPQKHIKRLYQRFRDQIPLSKY